METESDSEGTEFTKGAFCVLMDKQAEIQMPQSLGSFETTTQLHGLGQCVVVDEFVLEVSEF